MPICQNCQKDFPIKVLVDGYMKNLSSRKFCLECSPLGSKNTKSYIVQTEEDMAFCIFCNKIKDIEQFYKRKQSKKPLSYCIDCQNKAKKLKYEEKLERIVQQFGCVCCDCNVSYPVQVYEFYLNGKIYPISSAQNASLSKILSELKDHVMLCKNCCAIRKWTED